MNILIVWMTRIVTFFFRNAWLLLYMYLLRRGCNITIYLCAYIDWLTSLALLLIPISAHLIRYSVKLPGSIQSLLYSTHSPWPSGVNLRDVFTNNNVLSILIRWHMIDERLKYNFNSFLPKKNIFVHPRLHLL